MFDWMGERGVTLRGEIERNRAYFWESLSNLLFGTLKKTANDSILKYVHIQNVQKLHP